MIDSAAADTHARRRGLPPAARAGRGRGPGGLGGGGLATGPADDPGPGGRVAGPAAFAVALTVNGVVPRKTGLRRVAASLPPRP